MNLLALETSGEYCSVALRTADGSVALRHAETPARHTEFLLPACAALCAEAGIALAALDGIAFGTGPGAFTGVRVAASAAQGLALAFDLPVVGVSSLAALARGGWRATGMRNQVPILDARRGEIYWAAYTLSPTGDTADALVSDRLSAPIGLALPPGFDWVGIGAGLGLLQDDPRIACPALPREAIFPSALDVVALALPVFAAGAARRAESALPRYLRDPL
jgi:tRNA threonylcarbamoyladenosine biosynthesis protein TsaB